MKHLFPLIILLSAGCMSTNVPGVLEQRNFGFNQKFAKLGTSTSHTSTNGVTTNLVLSVDGYISDATENLKIVVDGLVKGIAAFSSGGASTLIPMAQPMMLMTPVDLSGPNAAHSTGAGQAQILYLVPVGAPQAQRMPMGRTAPNGLPYPQPPPQ